MSGHSSEDEEAADGLNIKPPQHVHRHHKDRKRDRSRRQKSRKDPSGSGPIDDERRRRHRQRAEGEVRGHVHQVRGERYAQPQQVLGVEKEQRSSRNQNKYFPSSGAELVGERHSSSSRRHLKPGRSSSGSGSRRPEPPGDELQGQSRRGDKRSLDLLSETKQKRRHVELENEKALRDIEKRREKERASGEGSGGSRHRKSHRQQEEGGVGRSKQQPIEVDTPSPEEEKQEVEDDLVHLEIQDIEESSSELEEGEERSKSEEPESEKSNRSPSRSPDREVEPSKQDDSKAVSDVSSDTSSSRKSRSEERSDISSSSTSSASESDHERENGEEGKLAGKVEDTDIKDSLPPSPMEFQMEDTKKKEPAELSRGKNANGSATTDKVPLLLINDVEEEEEKDLLPPYYPALQGCRRVEEFQLLNRIEEGTYGVVYRAKDKKKDEIVALKRLKMEKEKDGFPITSLREINTLLKAQHKNIVTVREIVVGSNTDKIFIVMDYVEHDLKSLMETLKQKGQVFLPGEVKCLMMQLLEAVAHLHDNWILHRDLKTSNLLLSHKGILKVGDFGLAREYGSPLKQYTPIVVTLWYRAPELLLGAREYSTPIDIWSVGCIFGELLKLEAMFPGKSEANQLNLIFSSLGTPNDRIWPGYSQMPLLQKMHFSDYPVNRLKTRFPHLTELGIDLMNKMLTFNPEKRFTAEEALAHKFFLEGPPPSDPSMFPTWPAKSEGGQRKAAASPKPPSGGHQFKGLKDDEDSAGFFLGGGDARRQPLGGGFSLKF